MEALTQVFIVRSVKRRPSKEKQSPRYLCKAQAVGFISLARVVGVFELTQLWVFGVCSLLDALGLCIVAIGEHCHILLEYTYCKR